MDHYLSKPLRLPDLTELLDKLPRREIESAQTPKTQQDSCIAREAGPKHDVQASLRRTS